MVVESSVLHTGPESSSRSQPSEIVKAVAFYSRHFHTHQTIQWALVHESICISYVSPLFY